MIVQKCIKLLVGLLFAGFCILLISRQLSPDSFLKAFSSINIEWVIFGFGAFVIDYACRIQRWRIMLNQSNPSLTWRICSGPFMGSFAVNNLIPFRAGDLLRAFAFNQKLNLSSGVIVATLFVERLLDLLMLLLLLGTTLFVFKLNTNIIAGLNAVTLLFIVLGIILFLLFPSLFIPFIKVVSKIVKRIAPSLGIKLIDELEKGLVTLKVLAHGRTMLNLIAWSLFAWLAEGCIFLASSLALPSVKYPFGAWLALPIGTFATLIPSTPGYIGTFDYFTIRAMTIIGNDITSAAAFAILVHIMLWLPPTIFGGIYLLLQPSKFHLIGAERK